IRFQINYVFLLNSTKSTKTLKTGWLETTVSRSRASTAKLQKSELCQPDRDQFSGNRTDTRFYAPLSP
ncbi:MAG: hypothetical protein ACKOC1_07225, partial [Hyphomicrobiales bacterium]